MRIKWKKIMGTLAIPAAIAAGGYAYEPPAELIEYRTEAEQGDTIWSRRRRMPKRRRRARKTCRTNPRRNLKRTCGRLTS